MNAEQIIQQAANWLTRLHDEDVSDAERHAFNTWCQADPRHAVAIERMRSLWVASIRCPRNRHASP